MTWVNASVRAVVTLGLVVCISSGAAAAPGDGAPRVADDDDQAFLASVWQLAMERLASASAALLPPLVPPRRVKVKWRADRVSSIDLRSPLLALAGYDLDGARDGRAELIALTAREVIVLKRRAKHKWVVLARAPLPPDPPAIQPRDPVGTLVIVPPEADGAAEVFARSSMQKRGVVLAWAKDSLVELRQIDGFPLCRSGTGKLDAGRNYFAASKVRWAVGAPAPAIPGDFFSAACRDGMMDPAGRPLRAFGAVTTTAQLVLRTEAQCRPGDAICAAAPAGERSVGRAGVAFDVADVDNDGHPEVVVAANRPPGDPDRVVVYSSRGAKLKPIFRRNFTGGVTGITAADIDGDGRLEVVTAVRLVGSNRIDFWTLN